METPRLPKYAQLASFSYAVVSGTACGMEESGRPCSFRDARYLIMKNHVVCAYCLGVLARGRSVPEDDHHECVEIANTVHLTTLHDVATHTSQWRMAFNKYIHQVCDGEWEEGTERDTMSYVTRRYVRAGPDSDTVVGRATYRGDEDWSDYRLGPELGGQLWRAIDGRMTNMFIPIAQEYDLTDFNAMAKAMQKPELNVWTHFEKSRLYTGSGDISFADQLSTIDPDTYFANTRCRKYYLFAHPESDVAAIMAPDLPSIVRPMLPKNEYFGMGAYLVACLQRSKTSSDLRRCYSTGHATLQGGYHNQVTRTSPILPMLSGTEGQGHAMSVTRSKVSTAELVSVSLGE
ncbi:hypothetical protein [Reovirus GCRV104]|nr:hypothetical protein [Reovirus GCRV104]